jgi:hypothetical protein
MAILQDHFFHDTIQMYVGVFGSVFDEIKIKRTTPNKPDKFIRVPIAYAVKKRYDVRNDQNPDPNKVRIKNQLPRMSFTMTGMQKDNSRMMNRMNTMIKSGPRDQPGGLATQRERVPYNFQFRLDVKTKNLVDILQILEQILVYFNPSIVVNVIDNPDLAMSSAIPIKLLNNSGFGDLFEGSFEDEEVIEGSLEFELEGYLYLPTSDAKIIKKVTVNYFDLDSRKFLENQVFTEADLP